MKQKIFTEGDFEYTVENEQATIGGLDFFRRNYYTCVTIPETLGGYPVTRIDTKGLGGWRGLRKITIPNSVTNIAEGALWGYKDLSLVFSKDHLVYKFVEGALIDKIKNMLCAYLDKKKASSCIIPSFVTHIGAKAFADCINLTELTIPDSVTSIGKEAFIGCPYLRLVVSKNHLVYKFLDGALFDKTKNILCTYFGTKKSSSYTIPNFVTSIATSAFARCNDLTEVTIPHSVTHIGEGAFARCRRLRTVAIPNSVATIDTWTFGGCTSLRKITIPNFVRHIAATAFMGCSDLTELTIPDSVVYIGDWAFSWCDSLREVTIPNSVKIIEYKAFYGCPDLRLFVSKDHLVYKLVDGVLVDKTENIVQTYLDLDTEDSSSYIIPDSVTTIDDEAFTTSIVIIAHEDSFAQEYALENHCKFKVANK